MKINKKKEIYYDLEVVRGLAAIFVVLGHARALYFVDYFDVYESNIFVKVFYFISGFGHQSVILFFVLSGFLISKSILDKSEFNWRIYLISRVTRLWIVLIPALFVTLIIDYIGIYFFGSSVYNGEFNELFNITFTGSYEFYVFIGNILFLQTIVTDTYGSNVPLWSLAYEFWYYIIFPMCYVLYKRSCSLNGYIAIVVIILCLSYFNSNILLYFFIWILGGIVCFSFLTYGPIKINRYLIYLTVIAVLFLNRFNIINGFLADFMTGVAFSLLIYSLISNRNQKRSLVYKKISRFLSNISYSLYLTHFPILTIVSVSIFDAVKVQPTYSNFIFLFSIVCFVVLFSYIFYVAFERHHVRLRVKFDELFSRQSKLIGREKL